MGTHRLVRHSFICIALALFLPACSSSSPSSPGGTGGGGGGGGTGNPGPSGASITIANGRVTPATVTISVGQSVTFINNDGRTRNMNSDPHPEHNLCPALNVGPISNGQSRLSGALTTARTCGYHDHDDPDNNNVKGTVIIVP